MLLRIPESCFIEFVGQDIVRRSYQGNDSLLILDVLFAHHGVGLASARLSVGKDADVVALEGVQQHFLSDIFVHAHLGGVVDVLGLWDPESIISHFLYFREQPNDTFC